MLYFKELQYAIHILGRESKSFREENQAAIGLPLLGTMQVSNRRQRHKTILHFLNHVVTKIQTYKYHFF